jgi:dihydroxyacetone kinase DhaKLM complex PTS-EIIA-like component DhaM
MNLKLVVVLHSYEIADGTQDIPGSTSDWKIVP